MPIPDGGWITRDRYPTGSGQGVCGEARSGPAYTATRPSKEQSDFTVAEVRKGRELSSPAAADPIAGSLAGVSLDDVQRAPQTPPASSAGHPTTEQAVIL